MRLIDIDSFDEWHDDGWDLYAYRQDIDKMPAIDAEELYSMVFKSGYDKGLRDALKELSELICANITRNDKPQTEYKMPYEDWEDCETHLKAQYGSSW